MNHRQRVAAALRGEPVDRVPIAMWRHFPVDDLTPEGLARATLVFQQKFDFDFVKVTPMSGYPAADWGFRAEHRGNREGTREPLAYPVQSPDDWYGLRPLDVTQGALGRELVALRLLWHKLGPEVPLLETVFSPLTVAKNLAGPRLLGDLRAHPQALHAALPVIADTVARFAVAALAAGADGLFFATQFASLDLLSPQEYQEFGLPYDHQVLAAVAGQTDFLLLHLHGTRPIFDLLASYPVHAVNWHSRTTPPTLAEARQRFRGCLVGGLDEWGTLQSTPEAVIAEVREAIAQAGERGLIIGPGCVIPIDTPEANIRAAKSANQQINKSANH